MRAVTLLLLLVPLALAGCQGTNDQIGGIGASFDGALGRDTQGTQRRMDVYGGATSPSLPTIGAAGFGK